MFIYLICTFVIILGECIENSYFQITDLLAQKISNESITIRLEGELMVGYGEDFKINDKSKIQIIQQVNEQQIIFGPQNFQIYCPALHKTSEIQTKCEIIINMYQINTTEIDNLLYSQLVIPVETNSDIRENPTLQIQTNFQLRLVDLAEQLKEVDYLLYQNCGKIIFIISDSLPITNDQIITLQKYSQKLEDTNNITQLNIQQRGKINVQNFTIDKRSTIHLFALYAIIFGVILLAIIKAFKKQDNNNNNQESKLLQGVEMKDLK